MHNHTRFWKPTDNVFWGPRLVCFMSQGLHITVVVIWIAKFHYGSLHKTVQGSWFLRKYAAIAGWYSKGSELWPSSEDVGLRVLGCDI